MGGGEVRQVEVPEEARTLTSLRRVDYEDAFLLPLPRVADRDAQGWAREVLERAPEGQRRKVLSGWAALGFELEEIPDTGSVLGWRIRRDAPDLTVLGATSPLGLEGELIFERRAGALAYATLVALDGDRARASWAPIETAHRRIVGELLADVARRGPNSGIARLDAGSHRGGYLDGA
jgi:hypothetical protein